MPKRIKHIVLAQAFIALLALAGAAGAAVTSVTVDRVLPFDGADDYRTVEATMTGTVARDDGSVGQYAVPIVLIHPIDAGNGAAVLDVVNTTLIGFGWIDDGLISPYARITTGDYLFEEGYTYLAVQWDKQTTDAFGPARPEGGNHLAYGSIEAFEDGFEILRDAARFLRDPSKLSGAEAPAAVEVVVSFGYSQTGSVQNAMLRLGEDYADGDLLFDGHLIGVAGATCFDFDGAWPGTSLCDGSPPEDAARIITIEAQTDLELFELFYSTIARYPDHANYRRYELAGISHIPTVYAFFHLEQNPVDPSPVFRAALRNLVDWVTDDIPAPPSAFLEGDVNPDGSLDAAYDSDGNVLGGLRLPHMAAPLGTYTGLWDSGEVIFEVISGTFTPFDEAELARRYPNRGSYVSRVAQAAEALYEDRYIIESDKHRYVKIAAHSRIGKSRGRRR